MISFLSDKVNTFLLNCQSFLRLNSRDFRKALLQFRDDHTTLISVDLQIYPHPDPILLYAVDSDITDSDSICFEPLKQFFPPFPVYRPIQLSQPDW